MDPTIVAALVAAGGAIIAALISTLGLIAVRSMHTLINSRMDELLEEARRLARAEGVEEGRNR